MTNPKNPVNPAPFVLWANHGITPPAGYDSFLAYAVATMDTRSLELDGMFSGMENAPSREDFTQAVAAELAALRQKAGAV
ncbi:hypothetical protein [Noviherbaspirillum sp. Root189]|uniref:hypothetical protein n=1 Tax=Noviherbaspirillum sp. Root189 TaxID=1736487 RepID=UPI00070F1C57|nr:hypothetical protein [Noviherbaspirillum sp. Root189]KRB85148.1 hypothetical protein ASE07_21540 [Noviherbaspirillum sp. Root189]